MSLFAWPRGTAACALSSASNNPGADRNRPGPEPEPGPEPRGHHRDCAAEQYVSVTGRHGRSWARVQHPRGTHGRGRAYDSFEPHRRSTRVGDRPPPHGRSVSPRQRRRPRTHASLVHTSRTRSDGIVEQRADGTRESPRKQTNEQTNKETNHTLYPPSGLLQEGWSSGRSSGWSSPSPGLATTAPHAGRSDGAKGRNGGSRGEAGPKVASAARRASRAALSGAKTRTRASRVAQVIIERGGAVLRLRRRRRCGGGRCRWRPPRRHDNFRRGGGACRAAGRRARRAGRRGRRRRGACRS